MLALSRQMATETHCALQGQHISERWVLQWIFATIHWGVEENGPRASASFFFLLNWNEARSFSSRYIYFTSSEMSSLSKLTLEPFCLTNSPQSSKWKSLLPRGLFPMLLPYSLSSLTLLGNKPAPVVTKVVTSLLSLYKVFLPDFLSPPSPFPHLPAFCFQISLFPIHG